MQITLLTLFVEATIGLNATDRSTMRMITRVIVVITIVFREEKRLITLLGIASTSLELGVDVGQRILHNWIVIVQTSAKSRGSPGREEFA